MTDAPRSVRRRPSWRVRVGLLAVALIAPLGVAELTLRAFPRLLPAWFRQRFPPNGIEFEYPGVLDRTPIGGMPLPYGVDPYDGPPPHDLVDFGVAIRADAEVDRRDVPRLVLPADHDGLPNAARPERPDIVLVGDSFTVFAAQLEPPGLQARLAARLEAKILNVAISGIGPTHEFDLLQRVGLPARPRLVVWMFFGGNDLLDSLWSMVQRDQGHQTWGQLFADRRPPKLWVPSLLLALAGVGAPARLATESLPGLPLQADPTRRLWFYPDTVRQCAQPQATVVGNDGWQNVQAVLRSAQAACADAGCRLLVVYLPSKEQVWLPRVLPDAAQLRRFAEQAVLKVVPVPADDAALLADLLANRGVLEQSLAAFCAAEGFAYWSATPVAEAFADSGRVGYYACDSHWRADLQGEVAEALATHVRTSGLLGK
jgi:hypothetical protein